MGPQLGLSGLAEGVKKHLRSWSALFHDPGAGYTVMLVGENALYC